MSELILFTLNAIVVYLLADWLVRMIEKRRGGVMKQRQVVFFYFSGTGTDQLSVFAISSGTHLKIWQQTLVQYAGYPNCRCKRASNVEK